MYILLKNTSEDENKIIYIPKQEGLFQNKLNFNLVSTCNCKLGY